MSTVRQNDRLSRLEASAKKHSRTTGRILEEYVPDFETLSKDEFDVLCSNLLIAMGEPENSEAAAMWEHVTEEGFLSLSYEDRVTLVNSYQ